MHSQTFSIIPDGPFSLAQAAQFGFGQRSGTEWDGVMRLAFCLDGYREQLGVEVRQDAKGVVQCAVAAPASGVIDTDAIRRQVARVLSLDHDGAEFTKVGERDPVIARLQEVAPGLRPPLFYSPYEAAAWCVLSARRPARQMMTIRQRLSEAHGQTFDLAGRRWRRFRCRRLSSMSSRSPDSPPTRSTACTTSPGRHSMASSTRPGCSSWVQTRPCPGFSASRASGHSSAR